MCFFLSTLAPLVIVTKIILSCTLPFTTGSLHTRLNFGCLCGSCQGTVHEGASFKDPNSADSLNAVGKTPSASFVISWLHRNMTRWIRGAGTIPPSVWLQALGTSHTIVPVQHYFMPFSTSAGWGIISLRFPLSSWGKRVSPGDLLKPLQTCIMQTICLSFSIQHEQNLRDRAHNTEASFKFS